jgi:2-dehydropantoate 2-reductase
MEVVIVGAGSLGSLLGAALAREHDVTLVGREPHVEAVRSEELALEGKLDAKVAPRATTDSTGLAGDLAVVAVKSFDTAAVAESLATGSFDAVLSVQNGMGNEETLAERVEAPVLAGTATYGAVLREPGVVECTGLGEVVLGARAGGHSALAHRIGEAFDSAGLDAVVDEAMPRRLWEKLAVNAGINAATALTRTTNGAVLESPTDDLARRAVSETTRVARAEGVDLTAADAVDALECVADRTAANESSMHQDLGEGRRTEIDAINGYVVDRAAEHGIRVPTNRTLASLVRTWERAHGLG